MDWKRLARLLNTPVDKLRARLSDPHERRLAAWEAEMAEQTRDVEHLNESLTDALARRRTALAEAQACLQRAEGAVREGDDARARSALLAKQDATARLAIAKKESESLLEILASAKEKLAATRAGANALLAEAGLPPLPDATEPGPDEPRVRVRID